MEKLSAVMRCFVRAYHRKSSVIRVFDDPFAEKLVAPSEVQQILCTLEEGGKAVFPDFDGSPERLTERIMEKVMPAELGRSAFCEHGLKNEIRLGCRQYVVMNGGFDTFALRSEAEDLRIFEAESEILLEEKERRMDAAGLTAKNSALIPWGSPADSLEKGLTSAGFDTKKKSFFNLMGISSRFSKEEFSCLLKVINRMMPEGSAVVLDHHEPDGEEGLFSLTGESYTERETVRLLEENGFLIYEYLKGAEITGRFFGKHNLFHRLGKMSVPNHMACCLAVKHRNK